MGASIHRKFETLVLAIRNTTTNEVTLQLPDIKTNETILAIEEIITALQKYVEDNNDN